MERIYTSIDLTKILDEEYDTRRTRIDHLHIGQLRRECIKEGIMVQAGCRKEQLVSKLQAALGEHTLVSMNRKLRNGI